MHNERDAGFIRREIERQCSIGAGTCSYDEEGLDATGLLTVHADLDIATLDRALSDPSAVHLNMLRGGIAKPTPANIWHLYGDEALIAAMPLSVRDALATRPPAPEDAGTVERVAQGLSDIIEHFEDRKQAPGHDHDVPGIWDDNISNREMAGKPCDWCAKWNAARAALAALSRLDGEKGA